MFKCLTLSVLCLIVVEGEYKVQVYIDRIYK